MAITTLFLASSSLAASGAATLALGAGVLNGSFATPTRFMDRWRWENVWSLWALLAMFVLP
jgi:L-rhamnose-H+ transport protein